MPSHRAARRLVGQHAIAVVLNIWNVVERAQQRARIKNRDHAVRAISAAILHYSRFHRGDASVILDAGFQIDDRARTSAMRPENLFRV